MADLPHADTFFAFARERYQIKLRRDAGAAPPWTDDPVFQTWRFCHVFREDDRTTVWFREHVRSRLSGLALVEATLAFRWFNLISTAERIEDLLLCGWNTEEARRRLSGVSPVVTGAYIVMGKKGMPKLDGILSCIDDERPLLASKMRWWGPSLRAASEGLAELPGLGQFTAYEIVCDLRHTPLLNQATDVLTWANVGPGATRGIGWVAAGSPDRFRCDAKHEQASMRDRMRELLALSRAPQHWPQEWPAWELREVEHTLCEYDKYRRASNGQSLKRRFRGGGVA